MRAKTPITPDESKERVVAYIDRDVDQLLKFEKFVSGKTYSLIVQEALANQLKHHRRSVVAAIHAGG